jgi:toxin ParE1/3/4
MTTRLIEIAQGLESLSERGRPISRNRRELTVVWPYLIRYRIEADNVYVLEVRHGAQRPS